MATLSSNYATLADWASALSPDGRVALVVDTITPSNPILQDAIFMEGNLPTGHQTTILSGYSPGVWRKLYQGVPPTKTTRTKVTDIVGELTDCADIDKALADLNGLTNEFMAGEASGHIKGLGKTLAETIFYGNTGVNPERFMGLSPRYNEFSADETKSGFNVVNAGGVGSDNTSIWFVTWDPMTTFMIYPKGQSAPSGSADGGYAGISHTKEQNGAAFSLADANGNPFLGYRDWYKIIAGLCVRDWRYNVRICNIDVSDLAGAGNSGYTGAELTNLMIDAYNKLETAETGKTFIYCNRTVKTAIDRISNNKSTNAFSTSEINGKPQTSFWGIPIKICDSLLNTEARVV